MSEQHSVVARFLDGNVLKGITDDFDPANPSFHIHPADSNTLRKVELNELKALFFVKSLMGDSDRHDVRSFLRVPGPSHATKIAVRFKDNELICGYTDIYAPDRPGFFLLPASRESNNRRVYVMTDATDKVKTGSDAEIMVRKLLGSEAA